MTSTPVLRKSDLIDHLVAGCKPPHNWRIGTEHEKFLLNAKTLERLPYEGKNGIGTLLEDLKNYGWNSVLEQRKIIALKIPHHQKSITLEPGGQFELSGAPLTTLHETKEELDEHLELTEKLVKNIGGMSVFMGTDSLWPQEVMPWVPKGRYQVMRTYMPKKGKLGLDMMTRTCTVQVNLDFASEKDMIEKMRIGMALQPIATALFACSPFLEGKLTGYQSYRAHIWKDTDPDRCGFLPFVFDEEMGFERYVDYLLDVPMYFVHRHGSYINATGQSFHHFLKGQLPALPGEYPTLTDWVDHTTIVFPEVRLKRFLEMRGADCGPPKMLMALPAFWTGLIYDATAQDEALQFIRTWSVESMQKLHLQVPQKGLLSLMDKHPIQSFVMEILEISRRGLQRRGKILQKNDESIYLDPVLEIAQTGRTLSTRLIELYEQLGSLEAVVRHYTRHPII
ncbi:MAG: glutamate--cysteine ligase [Alphaproteobacteria bacterium]|nr:glutamate--cysteine ligase [Alphaproteobacteria bacterium]